MFTDSQRHANCGVEDFVAKWTLIPCSYVCRYYRKGDKQKIAEAFHVGKVDDFPLPQWDYNVAPTTMQPIIRANRDTGARELVSLRWV